MAVTSITNLAPSIPDQFPENAQDPQSATSTSGKGTPGNSPVNEDTFTPSKQNKFAPVSAQDAGIFQVNQGAPTAVPENNQFAQPALNSIQSGSTAQTQSATAADAISPQTTATQSSTATNAATHTDPTPATETTANTAATGQVQNQIQSLNAALPSLGLTNEEIQQIDRIASLVGNFNPAAYASLVGQFESLAQQAAQQGAPNPGAAAIPGAAAPSNPSVSANGVTYQLQGALIHFSAQKGTENNGAGNDNGQGTASNSQDNPGGVQVAQAQFTLSTANGQTVHVQSPQQSTNAGTPNLQTPQIVALAG